MFDVNFYFYGLNELIFSEEFSSLVEMIFEVFFI